MDHGENQIQQTTIVDLDDRIRNRGKFPKGETSSGMFMIYIYEQGKKLRPFEDKFYNLCEYLYIRCTSPVWTALCLNAWTCGSSTLRSGAESEVIYYDEWFLFHPADSRRSRRGRAPTLHISDVASSYGFFFFFFLMKTFNKITLIPWH